MALIDRINQVVSAIAAEIKSLRSGKASLGTTVGFKDVFADRGDGTGVIYFGNTGGRFLYYNGGSYEMPGADLYVNGQKVWHASNLDRNNIKDILNITRTEGDPKLQFTGANNGTWDRIIGNGPLVFMPQGEDANNNPILFLKSNFVGINTIDPQYTLHVGGSFKAGTIMANPTTGSLAEGAAKGALEIRSAGFYDEAMMTFHIPGRFGVNLGLGLDNNLRIGGFSLGGASYVLWNELNAKNQWSGSDPYYMLQVFPTGSRMLIGSVVTNIDSAGSGFFPFAVAFPNVCHCVIASNGDYNMTRSQGIQIVDAQSGGGTWFNAPGATGSTVRINYVAFGW